MIDSDASPRIVVLASGRGGNFEALARAVAMGRLSIELAALVTDRPTAPCLAKARSFGINAIALPPAGQARAEYDEVLADLVEGFSPDWILLLGWMRILSKAFLSRFPGRVVNLHPALPGGFPGTEAIKRAWMAASEGRIDRTGAMLHLVPDEGVDTGPLIVSEELAILPGESLESLEERMHETEHRLVLGLAGRLRRDGIAAEGGNSRRIKVKVALVSVHDKTGLPDFARRLAASGFRFLATGGTGKVLRDAGLDITDVASYTKSDEMLGGRVKTLHPAIHGGILARGTGGDFAELESRGFGPIDLVVVNLYPFESVLSRGGASEEELVEEIDIGGVALTRAAAKNNARVTLACDPSDYDEIARAFETGIPDAALRRHLALKGFQRTAAYDGAISVWLASLVGDRSLAEGGDRREGSATAASLPGTRERQLRYGENPHQSAEYRSAVPGKGPLGGRITQGKELSYNNILDLDAALRSVASFDSPACAIVKHLSPCGIALGGSPAEAFAKALAADPVSAFGGVVAFNRIVDAETALALAGMFLECVAAPAFDTKAQETLVAKKNLRLLEIEPAAALEPMREIRSVTGGWLVQDRDLGDPEGLEWKTASKRPPTAQELAALRFAWKAVTDVRSNAIVLAGPDATYGIGGGQTNRVDAVRQAVERAGERARGSVMASDAYFPFADGIEEAARAGVTAVAHPGGSIRDAEVLAAADAAGMAVVFTGTRHFRH
ncbi:MAG TPA: bifunctional phosphoribosylaminoimidazolecarboxamide formyltransferase/IMP cyclohydrolase [Rectinemataceae bacterium]|nr:bifunctional phosphoribosylaminoimidazolecarboxamide formyltransferase/IMP cyclohydrolase [Rectinemataceae bacterium]